MGIRVYNAPKEISLPSFSSTDYNKDCNKYKDQLREWLKGKGFVEKETGTVIKFPVADGYAEYMVASVKGGQLLHIETGDAWAFPIHNYTKKAFRAEIASQIKFSKLFKQ